MKPYYLILLLITLPLTGCFVTPNSIKELSQRQDDLEAKMDELLEEVKAANLNTSRNMERIEKNQMLLAQEIDGMRKKSDTLGKKIEDVTSKSSEENKPNQKSPSANEIYSKADKSYKDRRYEDAILQFQQLIDNYPKDWRVPNAYLKQGNALINLDRKKEAGFFFKTLIDKYPNSPEANIARQKLKAI